MDEKYKEFPEIYDKYGFLKNGDYLSDPNFKQFFMYSLYDYMNILKEEGMITNESDIHNGFINKMHEEYLQKYCDFVSKNNDAYSKSSVQLLREQRERRAAKEMNENNNNSNNINNNNN